MKKHTKSSKQKHRTDDASTSHVADSFGEGGSSKEQPHESQQHEIRSTEPPDQAAHQAVHQQLEQIFWTKSTNEEEKTREEEFDDYLADLLL